MKTPRRTLSKRERFEVLKRDGFICRYCGRSAPTVVLHVDHVEPLSKGGSDHRDNMVSRPMTLAEFRRVFKRDLIARIDPRSLRDAFAVAFKWCGKERRHRA